MAIDNDKNVLLTHKKEITDKDLEEIKALRDLKEAIKILEEQEKKATGKKRYKLKKWLIEMHQEQYVIKDSYKPTMASSGAAVKNLTKISLNEHITIDEKGEPISNCAISFFNLNHVFILFFNYSLLK